MELREARGSKEQWKYFTDEIASLELKGTSGLLLYKAKIINYNADTRQ